MIRFFLAAYHFFEKKKALFYIVLIALSAIIAFFASKIRFEEDLNSFMPNTGDSEGISKVFKNIKVKDKVVVVFEVQDTLNPASPEEMIRASEQFLASLQETETGKTHVKSIFSKVDGSFIDNMSHYMIDNLPIFLDTTDYRRLDSLLTDEALAKRMEQNYHNLISPLGSVTRNFIPVDPLGLAGNSLQYFGDLQVDIQYDLYDEHIFSFDHKYLVLFIAPVHGTGEISDNEDFVDDIEQTIVHIEQEYPEIAISWFGGIPISVYNARQIKKDTILTIIITVLIIGVVILLAFRRKSSLLLIVLPVAFGGGFSLALLYLLQGTISSIAVGSGSVILGVALSYSMHVICHSAHSKSAEQVIRELAYPMTIGSFTTIAAFVSMVFLSSEILHDFGLFSCFTLIGTTLFCLIFLPHMLSFKPQKESRFMKWIERFNAYPFEKNYWLMGAVVIIFVVSLFFFNDVKFNSDMMKLSFIPDNFAKTEAILTESFQDEYQSVYFVSIGDTPDKALQEYTETSMILDSLQEQGLVKEYSSAHNLLIPPKEQERRIALWNDYWTPEKKVYLKESLSSAGAAYRFKPTAFDPFLQLLDKEYSIVDYTEEDFQGKDILLDWIDYADNLTMAITQVRILEDNKEVVYDIFLNNDNTVILDKPYITGKMVDVVNNDFNKLLYIVSIVVFFSILISYGRIEIALITFLPMAMSWIIILGIMGIFGLEFNIINIIISTFIFGIGDDFSIFVSDGLLAEYRTGKKILSSHKTSIFFSAFTVTVGLGAMVFSKHPALYSISVTSIIGMLAVILISYTIQPFVFRLFISGRTAKKKFPHTWYSLLITIVALTIFVSGSVVLTIVSFLLLIVPLKKRHKQLFFHHLLRGFAFFQLYAMMNERKIFQNPYQEDFKEPAIIIANHQSVIDILQMLTLHPKIIMVTKEWVSKSPLFGRVARFAGFVDITKGHENAIGQIKKSMGEGYSVVIFPEGSRSPDGKLRRFHKGAFMLAEQLKADIVPVLLHGSGQAMSKDDYLYLKDAAISAKILPRIYYTGGESYQERGKKISKMFRREHAAFVEEIDSAKNPYFHYKLMKNYIYKGPVLEWYTRIKVAMEKNYRLFETLVPKEATVTDIGCGYGFLPYMLSFRSDERRIVGIDYDEDKIAVANHNFSKTDRLEFVLADASEYVFGMSDVFILNDILHYLPQWKQEKILLQCIEKLNDYGKIIIRDGDREKAKKHALTKLTEFFSTRFFNFNKKEHEFHFISTEEISGFAKKNNLSLSMVNNDNYSSNTIYVLERAKLR